MFRSKKPKQEGPTEIFLKTNPNADINELLEKEDLSTQFREKNPYLIGYFLGKDENGNLNMKKIFEHIMKTENRDDQKKLFSLYQMSNTCLHRVLADSVDLSKTAFESVDQDDRFKSYGMGVFSRILSRAIDQWPEEIWQVFWNTEGALTKVIENLDSTCIYQSILDCFIQKQHPHISNLMWYIFLAFVSPSKADEYRKKPPSFTLFIEPVDDFKIDELHNSLKKYHKLNIISLLIEFFKCSLDKIREFHKIVFDYVATANEEEINEIEGEATIEFYPRLFEIARIIGPNKAVINKALEIIRQNEDSSKLKVQYCAQYLSVCSEKLDENTINEIIDRILNEKSHQFTITAILKLISYVIEDQPKWLDDFKKVTMKKIIDLWQKISKDHVNDKDPQNEEQSNFMLLDAILTIGRIIYNSEVNDIIQKHIDENSNKDKNEKKKDDEDDNEDEDEENRSDDDDDDDEKPDPNQDAGFLEDISKIGSNWENWDIIKDQIINWSQQDFIDMKDAKTEVRKKFIVIPFNDNLEEDSQGNQQGEDGQQDQDNQEEPEKIVEED